jgi:hypothetical protein
MKVLDRLPIFEQSWSVPTPDGEEEVKPYQIIIAVSITTGNIKELPEDALRIPAILDTGNNHNFAMRERQLEWSVSPALPRMGHVRVNGLIVPLLSAKIWIHPNRKGTVEPSGGAPLNLVAMEGIIVYPHHIPNPARLPILGLRAIIRNGLKLTIDGAPRELTMESAAP